MASPSNHNGFRMRDSSELAIMGAWFLLAVLACFYDRVLTLPLAVDNQHYFFIAERITAGRPPHVSQFDPKNALSMFLSAGGILAGRLLGIGDVLGSRIPSVLFGAAVLPLVWALSRALGGTRRTAALAALAMCTFYQFVQMTAVGDRPKVFLTTFVVLSLLAMVRRRPALAGVAVSAAFLCWQPALLLAACAVPALLLLERPLASLVRFALGLAVPVLLYEGYFLAHGALGTQLLQAFWFPSHYMSAGPNLTGMWVHLTWLLRIQRGPTPGTLVPAVAALGLVGYWLLTLAGPMRRLAELRAHPGRVYFALSGHAILLFSLIDNQGFPDSFWLMPYMAIVSAATVAAIAARLQRPRPGAALTLVWAAALLLVVGQSNYRVAMRFRLANQEQAAATVGAWIDGGKSVYAMGCTHLLGMAHRDNYSQYGFFFRGLDRYVMDIGKGRRFDPKPGAAPPDIVLVSRAGRAAGPFQKWLSRHYRRDVEQPFGAQGIVVWLPTRVAERNERTAAERAAKLSVVRKPRAPAVRPGASPAPHSSR